MNQKHRCVAFTCPPDRFGPTQCMNESSVKAADGKWYCKVHDPERVEARRNKWGEKYKREQEIREAGYVINALEKDIVELCLQTPGLPVVISEKVMVLAKGREERKALVEKFNEWRKVNKV